MARFRHPQLAAVIGVVALVAASTTTPAVAQVSVATHW